MNVLSLIVPVLSMCGYGLPACKSTQWSSLEIVGQDVKGTNPHDLASNLSQFGITHLTLGQFDDASKAFRRAVEIFDQCGPAGAPDAGRVYQLLGEVSQIEGHFAEAEAAYRKAIALLEQSAGRQDLRTASALNSLGWFYTVLRRSSEASPLLHRSWMIAQSLLPEDSPQLLIFLDSQASLACQSGRFTEAEKHWMRALTIAEKAYGDDARRYDAILMHLGQMYSAIGDYKPAEVIFQRSLASYEKAARQSSTTQAVAITQAVAMSELANVYTKLKKYSDAESLFSRSIQIVNSKPGFVPLGDALILSLAGDYYMARHDWDVAEQHYRRALKLRETSLGDHPLVASSLRSLSGALRKLDRKKEAKGYQERADQIMAVLHEPAYGSETIDVRAIRAK